MEPTEHDNNRVSDRLSQYEDAELVRIAQMQLPYVTTAYEVLFHRYHKPLVNICFRYLGSIEEAEETVSDTMFNVFNKLSRFEARSSFKTWVYKIAYNLSVTKLRKKQLELVNIDEAKDVPDTNDNNYLDEDNEQINKWLNTLSVRERSIIVFRVVGCLEFSEIAQIVEEKLSTVKMKYKRALEKMSETARLQQ
jgi:RNA polymerase sigma-70 factor (ECF subfamily)